MKAKVDEYIKKSKKWKEEAELIREIALECGLNEEFKWRLPCYTSEGNNIAIFQDFKEFCALMFFKGSLLKDPKNVLHAPGENSQAARRFEFTSVQEVTKLKATIKSYIKEAIKIEQAGLKVETRKEVVLVEELQKKFATNKKLKAAFEGLTPGRQRAYNLFFAGAKQSATRESRIEKCVPQILKGKGLND